MVVGAVMSSACRCGSWRPRALMLSADPLPYHGVALDCADNATGFGINPLSSHQVLVTLDSSTAPGSVTLPNR